MIPWVAKLRCSAGVGKASHDVPDIGVDRRRGNPNQHLVVPRLQSLDVPELEDVRRAYRFWTIAFIALLTR